MTEKRLSSPPAAAGRAPRQYSRWLCLLALVLLGGVISPASAQSKDVITFTGGQADPNHPDVYVINVGDVPAPTLDPETYEWSNFREYFTVTLRRSNAVHKASITLKDPIMWGNSLWNSKSAKRRRQSS